MKRAIKEKLTLFLWYRCCEQQPQRKYYMFVTQTQQNKIVPSSVAKWAKRPFTGDYRGRAKRLGGDGLEFHHRLCSLGFSIRPTRQMLAQFPTKCAQDSYYLIPSGCPLSVLSHSSATDGLCCFAAFNTQLKKEKCQSLFCDHFQ